MRLKRSRQKTIACGIIHGSRSASVRSTRRRPDPTEVDVTTETPRRTGLVLIHGGAHTAAACWGPVVDEIRSRAADLPVLAVNLPGR